MNASSLKVYEVKVPYGRGEMTAHYVLTARSPNQAKHLGNAASPCTAPLHAIQVRELSGLAGTEPHPRVICKL